MTVCDNCGIVQGPFKTLRVAGFVAKVCVGRSSKDTEKRIHECVERRAQQDAVREHASRSILR